MWTLVYLMAIPALFVTVQRRSYSHLRTTPGHPVLVTGEETLISSALFLLNSTCHVVCPLLLTVKKRYNEFHGFISLLASQLFFVDFDHFCSIF